MARHLNGVLFLACLLLLVSSAAGSRQGAEQVDLTERLLDDLSSKPLTVKDVKNELLKDVEASVSSSPPTNGTAPNETSSTPAPKVVIKSTTHINGCPVPALPLDFIVQDKWWQWTFSKEVLGMDGKTLYGTIKASMFGIPTKLSFYDKDEQLVAIVKWHFISFVGAHDFQDCKGKKLAESDEKITSRLFHNKHFSQYELKLPNGTLIAESSKTKFFNHQINLVDPLDGRALIRVDKNFMSFSNKWHVHSYVNDTTKHLVADPRIICLMAASQEGVPFMGWGSLTTMMVILSLVSCCCCCFGAGYVKYRRRQ